MVLMALQNAIHPTARRAAAARRLNCGLAGRIFPVFALAKTGDSLRLLYEPAPPAEDGSDVTRLDDASAIDRGRLDAGHAEPRRRLGARSTATTTASFLCYVPFADHNAMIDPSTPDLTGRVLEALGSLGYRIGHPAVDRGVAYLRRTAEADGSWFGRWGVNYIYGTWQALVGLAEVGAAAVTIRRSLAGADWLLAHQQAVRRLGRVARQLRRARTRGQGPPTASQTAWAMLGLVAAGLEDHPAVFRGIRYLTAMQNDDGTWDEAEFTGTGFPRVFYLRYHYYPIYFPLLALSQWAMKVEPIRQEERAAGYAFA